MRTKRAKQVTRPPRHQALNEAVRKSGSGRHKKDKDKRTYKNAIMKELKKEIE